MNRKRKSANDPNENAPKPSGEGSAAVPRQKTFFDSIAESELLLLLKQLILSLVERVENLQELVMEALSQVAGRATKEEKELYTPKEFAKIVGLKVATVQEYLRTNRIAGTRTATGRGGIGEWRITREELIRYQNEGKLPPEDPPYRYIR